MNLVRKEQSKCFVSKRSLVSRICPCLHILLDELMFPDEEIQFTINDQLFLEVLLMELRGQSISYASYKNKQKHNREKERINNIGEIEGCINTNNMEQLETMKTELFELRQEKLKGHIIRSKSEYIDKGEKPTEEQLCFQNNA